MKGKVFSLKIMLTLLLILTAGFCFALNSVEKQIQQERKICSTAVYLGEEGKEQEFSALFDGDVIFSAEKVKVDSNTATQKLVDGLGDSNHTFIGEYNEATQTNEKYVFQDLAKSASQPKTVIDNGDFVKFENTYVGGNYSIQGNSSLQEAIMISFGAYVYNPETKNIEIADEGKTIHAGISFLEVVAKKDGKQLEIPSIRDISTQEGNYFDFVCLIKQNESNEGFYQFSFKYMVNSREETASFEFSLVNNTSYTQNINPEGKDFGYNAFPTLGWTNDIEFAQTDYNRFYIGDTEIGDGELSFPTLTYDYTRYKISYKHTANQRNTQHELTANVGNFPILTWKSSNSEGNTNKTYELLDYNSASSINLVTLMFTEPGSYVFTYEYLHNGKVVSDFGFEAGEIKLAIYGMNTFYSKTNFEGAKMQYFEIYHTRANSVDLIVANGYEFNSDITSQQNKKLGFAYTLVENTENNIREGNVLTSNSKDALINKELKATRANEYEAGIDSDYKYLTINNAENVAKFNNADKLGNILDNIKYEETNQGSLWLEGNDVCTGFYFYHEKELTKEEIFKLNEDKTEHISTKIDFTNTTSFNKKGYYLVFLKVDPSGKSDNSDTYWQIFAFRYVSTAVDITVEALNTKNTPETTDDTYELVAGGKYTNKDVRISWKKPGVFDRAVSGYYFNATNLNYSKEQLLLTTKKTLSSKEQVIDGELRYVVNLGQDVQQNTFVKFLIRIESEGESATHKIFTIDRQGISGVQSYLIQEMVSGNSIYYTYATDKNNFIIPIQNAVTDGLATLTWNDKESGAQISASYIYTPFSVTSKTNVASITGNSSKEWILTNYELGTTIVGTEIKRSDSIYNVASDCILSNQGIYIVTLKDDAGNECRYSFVIDKTENYFKLQGEFLSNASVIYGDDVEYSIGDYKAFKLDLNSTNTIIKEFVEKATLGELNNFENYYLGTNNNASAITNLFQKLGNDYYFTVRNKKVVSYRDDIASEIAISGELNYIVEDGESSFIRTLYAVGENHAYSTNDVKKNAHVVVEINKDNARGMAYCSDGKILTIPQGGQSNNEIKRLGVGSDAFDKNDNLIANGLNKAKATSAKNVAFVWNKGTGNFEVAHVYYEFYSLKPSVYNDDRYYFYGSPEPFDLYKNGKWENGAYDDNNGRGIVKFNGDSDSKAGLYVVTRVYKDLKADLGDDVLTKNYYFIVDRNKIIDTNIGGSIRIQLLENEVDFNNFTVQNPDSDVFSNVEDGIDNERYNIYLTTNKLPATLNIPTGKYFYYDEENKTYRNSAGYDAGKLKVSVYFNDANYRQLTGQYKGATVKIYGSTIDSVSVDGCFNIDIYKYLTDVNVELRNRIAKSGEGEGTWLFLPGDYIIRITDSALNFKGEPHTTYIGFRITGTQDKGPKVDAFTGFDNAEMNKVELKSNGLVDDNHFEYLATVSQEYLKVVLPSYVSNVANNAQVDPNYVVIKQYYGENAIAEDYINHPYEAKNGITLTGDAIYEKYVTINADNSINLWLDTKLKVGGTIDEANLNKPLKYVVSVRYKIGVSGDNERYKDCYVFYKEDGTKYGKKVSYFVATYVIEIDRVAPMQNIEMLNSNDSLVKDYNKEFGTVSMTENKFHETSSNIYFTHQYAKYYQANKENKSYIYPYQVKSDTVFNATDVVKVLYKKINSGNFRETSVNDLKSYNLTLPLIDESKYTLFKGTSSLSNYGGLGLSANNYYEIVEFDAAGNATQYVIHYSPRTDEINPEIIIPTQILTTLAVSHEKELVLDYENNNVDTVNIYNITAKGAVQHDFENFFKIELLRIDGSVISTILTTATTDFDSLTQTIVDAINGERYGNLVLKITTRTFTSSIQINLYAQEDVQALDVKDLVDISGNTYKINLKGANIFDSEKNLWYFATKIEIKTSTTETYIGQIDEHGIVVYLKNGTLVSNEIECLPNTTYHITMTDVLGTVSNYRFNSSGQEFVVLEFVDVDNDAEKDYYQGNEGKNVVYYGFTDATLKYDKTIYSSTIWKKSNDGTYKDASLEIFEDKDSDSVYNIIKINSVYDEATGVGGLVEIKVDLSFEGYIETTYYITIDTRVSNVALRDYSTGEQRTDLLKPFRDADYTSNSVRADKSGSGIMNLIWSSIDENDYFNYTYLIHEQMDDETYRTTNLNSQTVYTISTSPESKGVYKFEIAVFGKDGTYLGNRIYAFEVQEVNTQIYYVRNTLTGEAVLKNSSFKVKNLGVLATEITKHTDCDGINEDIELPLFISNQNLEVVVTMSNVNKKAVEFVNNSNYTFTIYKISKENAYSIFIGVMKVDEPTHNLVDKVIVDTNEVKNKTSFTVASDDKEKEVNISVNKKQKIDSYGLLSKNLLLIDVYYMNEYVATEELSSDNPNIGVYSIQGNGEYSFIIKDLAGNIHEFKEDEDLDNPATIDKLNIYVLREVVVLINSQAPVDNAFYNDEVELIVYSSMKYVTGSIELKAERNGEPYVPAGYNPFIFTDYGTYRVELKARFGTFTEPLTKIVTFTILNEKEARQSIDFTSLNGSKIVRVINPLGQNVTEAFNNMLYGNSISGGMNISYEDIMEHSNALNVTSGKITFTLTYRVEDKIYPTRDITISFTMNNEVPVIYSTLEKGETTTKGFEIYFNPLIVYEQIGEAYVYINDTLIAHITEDAPNIELRVGTSFKKDGDGDYYIKLVSSSGVVLDSYKLTIKEPLNTWAIIVIIVVVGVVATVTITIIVLRRKMRIR